jgi:hypothetical protein
MNKGSHENFEKGMIYIKFLKKGGGSREKGGGGNEIHAPCDIRHDYGPILMLSSPKKQ